jgi:hypothetical protein
MPVGGNTETGAAPRPSEQLLVDALLGILPGLRWVKQTFVFGDFAPSGATGTKDFATAIPPGALILGWFTQVTTGFTGDTSCICQVGVSGTVGKYSADTTQSVFTAGDVRGSLAPVANGGAGSAALVTPRVTLTSGAAFSSVTAGKMTLWVLYLGLS